MGPGFRRRRRCWCVLRRDAANGPWICLKFADDFTAKSADNSRDYPAASRLLPMANYLRGLLMKSSKLIGLALVASFALSTAALAQDITIGVAGPMAGGASAFGRPMKNGAEQAGGDLHAAGGVTSSEPALEVWAR